MPLAMKWNIQFSTMEFIGRPDGAESGRINLGLLNNFEMKVKTRSDTGDGTKKIKLLENLNFSTGYDWLRDSLKWDNLSISGFTQLTKNIDFQFSSTVDLYSHVWDSASSAYVRIDELEWTKNQRIGRATNNTAQLNFNFQGGQGKKKEQKEKR